MKKKALFALLFSIVLSSVSSGAAGLGNMLFDDKAGSLKKAGMAPAVFPHTRHEDIYRCDECHPKIFRDRRGANNITMQKNMTGQFCGTTDCHNSPNAFPLYECIKCHREKK